MPESALDLELKRIQNLTGLEVVREFLAKFVKRAGDVRTMRLALRYGALVADRRKNNKVIGEKVLRRFELAKAGDFRALKNESYFLLLREERKIKENTMKGKKETGVVKVKRVTAASVLIPLLGSKQVPPAESIIEAVKKATGSTAFDERQLNWYKWKYRQGKLMGMDGKPHLIAKAGKEQKKVK